MDFFDRQDASRRATRWLVLLFAGAFLTVALATALLVAIAIGAFGSGDGLLSTTAGGYVAPQPAVLAGITAGTLLLMVVASLFRSATLSQGGGKVAAMLGGTRIHSADGDPLYLRLINVVEEMAIASGLPVPEIYVLEHESGINAFAAGLGHGDAAIAVTRGSLEQLSRAELRGVVAHEFSHILNGDMRLNLRLMGLAFGILVLSLIGRWLLRGARFGRTSRNRGGGAIVLLALGLTAIGGIGVLLSRLIKAAVSRQREVLADASAVQFTREPLALAGALKKIGGFTTYLNAVETEEVSHMLFGRGAPSFRGWFATHPPLPDRIRALDPAFREGDYPAPVVPAAAAARDTPVPGAAALGPTPSLDDVTVTAAGTIRNDTTARTLLDAIPAALHTAAHSVDDSLLLVVALALSADADRDGRQTALVRARLGDRRTTAAVALSRELQAVDRRLWLPLVEIAVPALKRRPPAQIDFLFDLLQRLAAGDGRLSLFEYALLRLLSACLRPRRQRRSSDGRLADAWLATLATVAACGHREREAARAALGAGAASLPGARAPANAAALDTLLDAAGLETLDDALETLAGAPGGVRRDVLASIETTIRHDGRIGIEESELLRAIGAVIACPIPPPRAMR